jgi:hypothetical protein
MNTSELILLSLLLLLNYEKSECNASYLTEPDRGLPPRFSFPKYCLPTATGN